MLNISQLQTNALTVSDLYSKVSIPDASLHYLFIFTDFYNRSTPVVLEDQSLFTDRYSIFYFTDGSDGTIRASGEYNIYESPIDSSVLDASIMNLLENGQYTFFGETYNDVYYEPSVNYSHDVVYDPSYPYAGYDVIFSPAFSSGTGPVTTLIPHNDLTDRDRQDNHPWALPEASLGSQFYWDAGKLQVTDVSGVTPDVSKEYIDGSLAARDLSINELYSIEEAQDPSIVSLYEYTLDLSTRLDNFSPDQDPSIQNLYETKQDLIADGTYLLESSLGSGFVWNGGSLDVSLYIPADLQDPSIVQIFEEIENLPQDASIADLYQEIENLPQDASIADLYQEIENLPQDASIADLYQEIEDLPQDASIGSLYDYALDISTRLDNFDPDQDASINDLYSIKENKVDVDSSLADVYTFIGNIPQDSSIENLYETKQDLIVDGTFLKESSIGSGLVWNAGLLDVSIDIPSADQDPSISELFEEIENLPQDASINDLYSIKENRVDVDSSLADVYTFIGNISQDTSIADLYDVKENKADTDSSLGDLYSYIDGSLSDKVDKTTHAGTASAWINSGGSFVDVYTVDGTLGGSVLVGPTEIAVLFSDSWDQTFGFRPDKAVSYYPIEYEDVDEDWTSDAALVTKGYGNANYDQAPAIASLSDWNIAEDASIDELRNKDISQDASIVLKADKSYVDAKFIPNASIGDGLVWNAGQLDVSVAGGTGDVTKLYVDGSLNAKQNIIPDGTYVKEASLGDGLVWNAGQLDVSVEGGSGVSREYVDGSLATKVNKTDLDTSLGLYVKKAGDTMTGNLTITGADIVSSIGTRNARYGPLAGAFFSGTDITAIGYGALSANTSGTHQTAVGSGALGLCSSSAANNVALGRAAGYGLITGNNNAFIGHNSGYYFTTGNDNTAVGKSSAFNYGSGSGQLTTATQGVFLGNSTRASADGNTNEIVIGYNAVGNGSNTVTLGNTSITKTYLRGPIYYNGAYGLKMDTATPYNTTFGYNAGLLLTSTSNVAIGYLALSSSSDGTSNTVVGYQAMPVATSASYNTALGYGTLLNATSGQYNVVAGYQAGRYAGGGNLVSVNNSVLIGYRANPGADAASNAIAIGHLAVGNGSNTVTLGNTDITKTYLRGEVQIPSASTGAITMTGNLTITGADIITATGTQNTRLGEKALLENISGTDNTAIGNAVMQRMQTGIYNTALGSFSLNDASSNSRNTAIGRASLLELTTGDGNVAIGETAGRYYNINTNLTSASYSTLLGTNTRASANGNTNEIVIGYNAVGAGSNTVTLGNTSVTAGYLGGKEIATKDTSILTKTTNYTVVAADNNDVLEIDASITVTLPNNVNTGFQITIVNASTGHVTIDASTIRSVGGAKILKDQYAGASAVHRGAGVWYVFGNLS